jgi:hypothetical protein
VSTCLSLDTSAVLRAILENGITPEIEARIATAPALVTSRLSLVESSRALRHRSKSWWTTFQQGRNIFLVIGLLHEFTYQAIRVLDCITDPATEQPCIELPFRNRGRCGRDGAGY